MFLVECSDMAAAFFVDLVIAFNLFNLVNPHKKALTSIGYIWEHKNSLEDWEFKRNVKIP